MTFTQLSYFVQVVEYHSLTKVAEIVHVSQPAVSSAIRDLESEFHIQLFYRTHRELTLTPDGAEFYQKALELLRHYETFRMEMLEHAGRKPNCSLALTLNFAPVYLPDLYIHLKNKMPEVNLDLQELTVSEMFRRVKNGLLDAACLGHDSLSDEEWEFHKKRVGFFSMKLCVHKDLAVFQGPFVAASQLKDIPMALYHHGGTMREKVDKEFARFGIEPNIQFSVNQVRTIEEIVRRGLAASFLPEQLAREIPGVQMFDFRGMQKFPAYIIWKNETPLVKKLVNNISLFFKSAEAD